MPSEGSFFQAAWSKCMNEAMVLGQLLCCSPSSSHSPFLSLCSLSFPTHFLPTSSSSTWCSQCLLSPSLAFFLLGGEPPVSPSHIDSPYGHA